MAPIRDLSNQRFGRLIAIRRCADLGYPTRWQCICDCGKERIVFGANLTRGLSKSCGCLHSERSRARYKILNLRHGEAGGKTPEYRTYSSMLSRCYNQHHIKYPLYGGRGITVCARWRDGEDELHPFLCFLADVGRRPGNNMSLDRYPDGDGNYEPGNVRWATISQQNSNRRTYTKRQKI